LQVRVLSPLPDGPSIGAWDAGLKYRWEHTKEGEVADNKRGRSTDDEFDENAEFDANDELDEFDAEDVVDDDEAEADEAVEEKAGRRGRQPAKAGVAARSKTKARGDGVSANIFARIVHYIREVVAELQKVIWPTRKELLTYTAVVVVFVTVIMTVVSLLDVGFAKLMFLVFGSKTTT
jgi:preprotein translocase subunit SecE